MGETRTDILKRLVRISEAADVCDDHATLIALYACLLYDLNAMVGLVDSLSEEALLTDKTFALWGETR